uniref:Transcription factor E4F1 n=1 Tax=Ceratitis capitata TaxID=7213 RepID=W8C0Y6_CERCA
MEILMKLKCSSSVPPHGNNNTTLKVVDHHHQLTQQHAPLAAVPTAPPPSLIRLPSSQTNVNYNSSPSLPPILLQSVPRMSTTRPCLNYSKPPQCCNVVAAQQGTELFEPIWDQQGRRGLSYEVSMQRTPNCCANVTGNNLYETTACCSGTCHPPAYVGTPPPSTNLIASPLLSQPPPLQQAPSMQPPPLAYPTATSDNTFENCPNTSSNTHYEYQEPEENFISIEDNKIKSLLMKIGRECALERKKEKKRTTENATISAEKVKEQQVLFEIIDLDDEDDREELRQIRNQAEKANLKTTAQTNIQHLNLSPAILPTIGHEKSRPRLKSPSISLIPKSPTTQTKNEQALEPSKKDPSKERIIAHIELSDSSDSETECVKAVYDAGNPSSEVEANVYNSDDEEDEELSFVAAAVSCELECDDDENDVIANANEISRSEANNSSNEIVVLNSDDENVEFVDEQDKRLELRWEDLVRREKGRQFFECYLCGKKVQSSYNLRRHMMIHTGERPFACDMCDRRFREFSDLKKHRRRHSNEPNFVCMVCRVKPPMIQDPTRCSDCDSKTIATTAATVRPQYSATPPSSPEKPQSPLTPTPPPQLPPLIAKPLLPTESIHDFSEATTITTAITTLRNNNNTTITLKSIPQPTSGAVSPKRSKSTPLLQSDLPSLVPINAPITLNYKSGTHSLLDNIPAVHRPNYNQLGVMTRKEFPCPLCQRAFGTRHNLKRHFMIHTGEKPFSCSKCRKPFREYSTLKKHMVTHQRERYYKCLHCPSKYRDYLEYSEHKRTHVSEDDVDDDEETNFDPQQLSSSSSTSSPQKRAKTRYDSSYDSNEDDSSTEDCWLECCECKQRFTEIESYTKHLKEHDPSVYFYECYICKKTFEQRDELVEHVGACKEELRETALQRATCFK